MPFHLNSIKYVKKNLYQIFIYLVKASNSVSSQAQENNATANNVTSILIQRGVRLPKEVLYFEKEFKCQPTPARHDKNNMELSQRIYTANMS